MTRPQGGGIVCHVSVELRPRHRRFRAPRLLDEMHRAMLKD
jgi:hypothetical protein